jgi:hypothetical protein
MGQGRSQFTEEELQDYQVNIYMYNICVIKVTEFFTRILL